MSIRRLSLLARQVSPRFEQHTFATIAMARMDINIKYKMLSGYEIPALGYGVCPITLNDFLIYAAGNIAIQS